MLVKIENKNGINVVSSRVVAEQLGKRHADVLRDIRDKSLSKFAQWIIPTKYKANNGQEYDEFLLTKDGFVMLVFNYEGYLEFKEAYINEFNRMEQALKSITNKDSMLLDIIKAKSETETALALNKYEIEYVKPLEDKIEVLTHSPNTYTTTEIAKELGFKSAIQLNKVLEEKKIQYKVNGTWVLTSKYSDLGYVSIKQDIVKGNKAIYDRRWTQEGREFLINKLK